MSISTEEYMEALYTLTLDGTTASTKVISERLNITMPSVTEMLKKLADKGYLIYLSRQGVRLTPKGIEIAEKMVRKHRLLECFLHDILHIGNGKVHNEACAMEHALSDESERALCQLLKEPDKCPDDDKLIPPCNLNFYNCRDCKEYGETDFEKIQMRKGNIVPLSSLKEGQEGVIAFVRGENQILSRLYNMGLTPGTKISMSKTTHQQGPVEVVIRGCKLGLVSSITCNVFIENPG